MKNIRVNAISLGPMATRATPSIEYFDGLLQEAKNKYPLHRLVDLDDVGYLAAFLLSNKAKNITGNIHYVDTGYEIID